jgi:hypothetical protein
MTVPELIAQADNAIAAAHVLTRKAKVRGQMLNSETFPLVKLLREATAAVQEIDNQSGWKELPKT